MNFFKKAFLLIFFAATTLCSISLLQGRFEDNQIEELVFDQDSDSEIEPELANLPVNQGYQVNQADQQNGRSINPLRMFSAQAPAIGLPQLPNSVIRPVAIRPIPPRLVEPAVRPNT